MLLLSVVSVFLLILVISPAHALFSTDVKKAKEFMSAGMYPQAIELLNKHINDKPTDAEAHFQLGVCYINTGNYGRADARFGSAVKLKSDYGYQIGGKYKKVGDEALNKGRTGQAQNLYQKAVQYQPNLKTNIAKECLSAGEKYLNQHQSNVADGLLSMAVKYNASLSQSKEDITKEYGEKLLATAKDKPKNGRRKYVDEAKKYLAQQDIDAVLPPPGWKTVFKKTFVGVGHTGGDDKKYNDGGIWTAKGGRDVLRGDRITVIDSNFEYWYDGGWNKYSKGERKTIYKIQQGNNQTFRNEKGKKFTVVVERYTTSY